MMRNIAMAARAGVGRLSFVLVLAAALTVSAVAAAGSLGKQVSRDNGIEVSVTPGTLAPGAELWEFEVAFNTHSGSLDGDPAASSVLVDAQGKRHAALAWDGSPSGGHHRSGTLRFPAPAAAGGVIELRIAGVGGIEPRAFRWQQ